MKTLLILATGRSGSMFLHSLFDGHPEVVTYPAVHGIYSPFFRAEYVRTVDDAVEYLSLLTRVHIHFEGRYDEAIGRLDTPGGNFRIDRERFLPLLREEFGQFSPPFTRRHLVESLHRAYGRYSGQDLSRASLLVEHVHSPSELENALVDFPDAYCVHTIRDPCNGYYGMIDLCSRAYGHFKAEFFYKFTKNVFVDPWIALAHDSLPGLPGRYRIVRIEDLNARGDHAVDELCEWLGISRHEKLRTSTIGGHICHGNSGRLASIATFKRGAKAVRTYSRLDTLRVESLLREQMLSKGYRPSTEASVWNEVLGALAALVPLRSEVALRPIAIWRDARTDARNFPLARIVLLQARHRHPRVYHALLCAGFADGGSLAHKGLSAALLVALVAKRTGFDPWYFYLRRVALLSKCHLGAKFGRSHGAGKPAHK